MMKLSTFVIALAGALAILPGSAAAQAYPLRKPIRFMVPFAPGGGSDVVARIIAVDLGKFLGQQLIIDNRAGAQGVVGSTIVSQATPDGYTIMLAHVGTIAMNPWLFKNIYDPVRDFSHITLATSQPTVVVVNPAVPAANLQALIALAKSKPGGLSFASGSTIGQLSGELLLLLTGTKMLHVPYKGGSQAILDVVSGRVEMVFGSLPASLPMVKAGKVKVLAVAGPKRLPAIPDVPTAKEAGLPEFDVDVWYSIAGPAKMPKDIVTKLNTELRRVLDLPDVKQKLIAQGVESATNTPEQMTSFVREEHKRWGKVVKAAGLEGAEK
jgi:tripartite-type tricarboxylate transporter receptor subunit TctC